MRILGIDPSLASTGWAILEYDKAYLDDLEQPNKNLLDTTYKPTLIDCGAIKTDSKNSDSDRIFKLYTRMHKVINFYKPDAISIEDQYGYLNTRTLKQLSQVRGIYMFLASQYSINMYLYAPSSIKKIATGSGKAKKEEVVNCMNNYFNLELNVKKENDIADAIAIALSYLLNKKKGKKI